MIAGDLDLCGFYQCPGYNMRIPRTDKGKARLLKRMIKLDLSCCFDGVVKLISSRKMKDRLIRTQRDYWLGKCDNFGLVMPDGNCRREVSKEEYGW